MANTMDNCSSTHLDWYHWSVLITVLDLDINPATGILGIVVDEPKTNTYEFPGPNDQRLPARVIDVLSGDPGIVTGKSSFPLSMTEMLIVTGAVRTTTYPFFQTSVN